MSATVDKSEDRVRQMFGEISGRYDLMNHLLSGGIDYYWRWRTVRAVAPEGADPILDVCTGTGDLALAYWNAGRRRIPVMATDFTPEMLRLAELKRDRQLHGQAACELAPLTFLKPILSGCRSRMINSKSSPWRSVCAMSPTQSLDCAK